MKKHETYKSNFLKAEQLETAPGKYKTMAVTVTEVTSHTFDDGKAQRVLTFRETEQQLGLNLTNWDSMADITGKADDDEWIGAKVELWVDKNVMYGGKKIPAIRIREIGGGAGEAAPEIPGGSVYDKRAAWTEFCAIAKAKGEAPNAEVWKGLVTARMNTEAKEQDSFTAADWKAIVAMAKDDASNVDDGIPF